MSDRVLDDNALTVRPTADARGGEPGKSTLTSRLPGRSARGTDEAGERAAAAPGLDARPHDPSSAFGVHLVAEEVAQASAAAKETDVAVAPEGAGESVAGAAGKSNAVPRVSIVSPTQRGVYDGNAHVEIDVFGTPNSTAALYLTVYSKAKMIGETHAPVPIGASGSARVVTDIPVENDGRNYALHARASSAPGVFSPLRVVEFLSVIDTHGGEI